MGVEAVTRLVLTSTEAVAGNETSQTPLPNTFVAEPGTYLIGAGAYELAEQGYYAYSFYDEVTQTGGGGYRLIVDGNAPDAEAIVSGIAWACSYGKADEGSLTQQQRLDIAKTRRLSMSCGHTCLFASAILNVANVAHRTVRLLTGETPNNVDDGHVALEVWMDGAWVLVDFMGDHTFEEKNLRDVIEAGVSTLDRVQLATRHYFSENVGSFSHAPYYDAVIRDVDAWQERIFQIPGVVHTDGKTYFYLPSGLEDRESYVEGLWPGNFTVVSKSTWEGMFYA